MGISAPGRLLPLILAGIVLQGALADLQASKKKQPDEGQNDGKPRLVLQVDPSFGFTPVVAVLTAELSGVDPADANFCHASVTWIRLDPGDTEDTASTLRQDPACRHAEDETRVTMYYTKMFTLSRPGPYLFRVFIEGRNGRRITSGYAKVRVLRVQ